MPAGPISDSDLDILWPSASSVMRAALRSFPPEPSTPSIRPGEYQLRGQISTRVRDLQWIRFKLVGEYGVRVEASTDANLNVEVVNNTVSLQVKREIEQNYDLVVQSNINDSTARYLLDRLAHGDLPRFGRTLLQTLGVEVSYEGARASLTFTGNIQLDPDGCFFGAEVESPLTNIWRTSVAGHTLEVNLLGSVTLRFGPGWRAYLKLAQVINERVYKEILKRYFDIRLTSTRKLVIRELIRRLVRPAGRFLGIAAFVVAGTIGLLYIVTLPLVEGRRLGAWVNYAEGYVPAVLRTVFPRQNYCRNSSWRTPYRTGWDDGELAVFASSASRVKGALERSFRERRPIDPRYPLENLVTPMGQTLARYWPEIGHHLSERERRATA